jgi:hypothetical protein
MNIWLTLYGDIPAKIIWRWVPSPQSQRKLWFRNLTWMPGWFLSLVGAEVLVPRKVISMLSNLTTGLFNPNL